MKKNKVKTEEEEKQMNFCWVIWAFNIVVFNWITQSRILDQIL